MPDALGFKGAWRWYLIALLTAVADQLSKGWIVSALYYGEVQQFTGFFNLVLVHNQGAAFSFLSDAGGWQRWFFTVLATGVSAIICVWLSRLPVGRSLEALALALVLGGAVGNLYDRLLLGYVIDFLDFHWNGRHWPAFNIADSAICVGAVLLVWDSIFSNKTEDTKSL